MSAGWLAQLTASAFDQLGQYAISLGVRTVTQHSSFLPWQRLCLRVYTLLVSCDHRSYSVNLPRTAAPKMWDRKMQDQ